MLIAGLLISYAASRALIGLHLPPTLGFAARSINDLLLSMTLLDTIIPSPITNGVTWSLVPEVGFYAMLVAVWPTLSRRPLGSSYLMVALVALIKVGTMAFVPFKPAHYFYMQVEFILVGRAIYLWWAGIVQWRAAMLLAATALSTFAALHVAFASPYVRGEFFGVADYSVAVSWAFAIIIFMALMRVGRCPRILRFVSDRSYSIYLLHIPIGSLVLNILCLRYGWPIGGAFLMALPAVLAASYATYRLVEVPGQRLGRRVAALLRQPAPVASAVIASS